MAISLWFYAITAIYLSHTRWRQFGVNFINVKRTNFSYERRFSSYVLALSKNSYEKRARKTLMKLTLAWHFFTPVSLLPSISSMLNSRIFRTNVVFLVTFWLWQKICTKNLYVKRWWNWHLWFLGQLRKIVSQ